MKKQAMKAELTSGTRGKFYRESTPGSRIKKGIKGVIKGVSKVIAPSTGIISNILTGGKSLPLEAARTGFKKPSSFKLRSGNKPSIAKLAGIKRDPKDPFYVMPKGPEVKDNMPKPSPKELQKIIEKEKRKTPKGFIKIPKELKNLPSKNKPKGVHGYTITKDIKKRK